MLVSALGPVANKKLEYDGRAIEQHRLVFQNLVVRATDYLHAERWEAAAAYAQIAACYAWYNHPGLFACVELEDILLSIGRSPQFAQPLATPRDVKPGPPQRVLHVLSEAYSLGGHTRFAWRWMQQDAERVHSVVLLRQRAISTPPQLRDTVLAAGGEFIVLPRRTILAQAKVLRSLAQAVDQVVLHIHPDDTIPIIALANIEQMPPIIFVNHTDHVFWLGAQLRSVIANIRTSGMQLSITRRGISPARCAMLPIPLTLPRRLLSRAEAKERLGLPADTIVLLSVATAYKYSVINDNSFVDVLTNILELHPQAVLLVVGPTSTVVWREASNTTHGRVRVFGRREDVDVFYQAADIYVDSFPFASLTSLLEAASYGTPVVSFNQFSPEAEILSSDDLALDEALARATNREAFTGLLDALIEDAPLRTERGMRMQQRIIDIHVGTAWLGYVRDAYAHASRMHAAPEPQQDMVPQVVNELDILLALIHQQGGLARGLDRCIHMHLRMLPIDLRFKEWLSSLRKRPLLALSLLLPPQIRTPLVKLVMKKP